MAVPAGGRIETPSFSSSLALEVKRYDFITHLAPVIGLMATTPARVFFFKRLPICLQRAIASSSDVLADNQDCSSPFSDNLPISKRKEVGLLSLNSSSFVADKFGSLIVNPN